MPDCSRSGDEPNQAAPIGVSREGRLDRARGSPATETFHDAWYHAPYVYFYFRPQNVMIVELGTRAWQQRPGGGLRSSVSSHRPFFAGHFDLGAVYHRGVRRSEWLLERAVSLRKTTE